MLDYAVTCKNKTSFQMLRICLKYNLGLENKKNVSEIEVVVEFTRHLRMGGGVTFLKQFNATDVLVRFIY